MKTIIRNYKDDDLDSVNVILNEAFHVSKKSFFDSNFIELVAEYDGEVCGYLLLTCVLNPILEKKYFLVDYVCVLSKYRGLGISDELMKYAETVARERGAMYLQLTCSTYRISAHRLYERCGYMKRDSDIYRKVIE